MLTKNNFLYFLGLGFSVVAVRKIERVIEDGKSKKKVTFAPWKKFETELASVDDISSWFEGPVAGIAMMTGSISGVVVVDIDEKDQARYPFLKTPLRVRTPGSGGVHYYFKYSSKLDKFGPQAKLDGLPMDYRGRGGLVFLPGTVVDGKDYELCGEMDFSGDINSLPELPDEVYRSLSDTSKDAPVLSRVGGSYVLPKVFQGERNQETTRICGKILAEIPMPYWENIAYPSLLKWNSEQEEPLREYEMATIFNSIGRTEARKQANSLIPEIYRSSLLELIKNKIDDDNCPVFTTGYKEIDENIGGLRQRNMYLVSGLEKCGKSGFLMKILDHKLRDLDSNKLGGSRIGYINTELTEPEFAARMAGYALDKGKDDVTKEEILQWADKYADKFEYLGPDMLGETVEETADAIKGFLDKKIDCLILDNLTTWGNKIVKDRESYEIIANLVDKIGVLTKKYPVVTLVVIHTRQTVAIPQFPKTIKEDDYENVFTASQTFIRRPSLNDVYGGGKALSQLSGTFFVWRPFQKMTKPELQQKTGLIVESMRHSPDCMIRMTYDGSKGLFESDRDVKTRFSKDVQNVITKATKPNLFGLIND